MRQAYRAAGLDLRRDLDRLAAAPRIAPDHKAVAFVQRYGVPTGRTPVPVVTLHTTGDGGAVPDQENWYADQVRRNGDSRRLRQLYIERGGHCSFSAAEEIVMLRTLFERVESGRWPDTNPHRLNEQVAELGPGYHLVLDFGTFTDATMAPAFVPFAPPESRRAEPTGSGGRRRGGPRSLGGPSDERREASPAAVRLRRPRRRRRRAHRGS